MQLDKLTSKSQEAVQEAQRITQGYSQQEMDGEHWLPILLLANRNSLEIPRPLCVTGPVPNRKPWAH
jgi:hypothetical protein